SNPHVVRRLREKVNCQTPEDVIQFLKDNKSVPTRYKNATDLAAREEQFPVLPPRFEEGEEEAHADTGFTPGQDDLSGYRAARAWFAYANLLVPPNPVVPDDDVDHPLRGSPVPSPTPRGSEFDQFKYRLPRLPRLI